MDEPTETDGTETETPRKGWRIGRRSADPAPEAVEPGDAEEDERTPRELAVERAEGYLAGPALTVPDDAPSPADLEATWDDHVLDALERLRADLGGRRTGLAISGGGSLGSFEAGVLRFLYDHAAVAPIAVAG